MSGVYLHVRQHSVAWTLGLMAWLKSPEATVAALPSPQHLYGGFQQLRGICDRLALHWVTNFRNGLIWTFALPLSALLHKAFSTAWPRCSNFLHTWQNGFSPAIGLQSMMLADNLVHSQTLVRVSIAF